MILKDLKQIYLLYKPIGKLKAYWTIARILTLPASKIDKLLPKSGTIIDIGAGQGGLTNFLFCKSMSRNLIGIDMSKSRIADAKKTVNNRRNIKFIYGDAVTKKISKANVYLMVDVLHHISYPNQEKLLKYLASVLTKDNLVTIKEVDKSNLLPYLFGHLVEKILYPRETIYTRSKEEWIKLFNSLGWKCKVETGNVYFPDSTLIFVCKRKSA